MKFTAKVYRLGKSGRMAVMLPKGAVIEPGDYEMDIPGVVEIIMPAEPQVEIPPEAPVV